MGAIGTLVSAKWLSEVAAPNFPSGAPALGEATQVHSSSAPLRRVSSCRRTSVLWLITYELHYLAVPGLISVDHELHSQTRDRSRSTTYRNSPGNECTQASSRSLRRASHFWQSRTRITTRASDLIWFLLCTVKKIRLVITGLSCGCMGHLPFPRWCNAESNHQTGNLCYPQLPANPLRSQGSSLRYVAGSHTGT